MTRLRTQHLWFSILLLTSAMSLTATAQPDLKIGDTLDPSEIELVGFGTGDAFPLDAFSGKILYLEWFYWW